MGWEPAVDWEAAVSRTVSWFSERLAVDSIVARFLESQTRCDWRSRWA